MDFYHPNIVESLKDGKLENLPDILLKRMNEKNLSAQELLSRMKIFEETTKNFLRKTSLEDEVNVLFTDIYGSSNLGQYFCKIFALIEKKFPSHDFTEGKNFCRDFEILFREPKIYVQAYNPFDEETNRRLTRLMTRTNTKPLFSISPETGQTVVRTKGFFDDIFGEIRLTTILIFLFLLVVLFLILRR